MFASLDSAHLATCTLRLVVPHHAMFYLCYGYHYKLLQESVRESSSAKHAHEGDSNSDDEINE